MKPVIRIFQALDFKQWVIFWLVVGLVLRLFVIIQSGWRIDFDEAFNGLLAYDIMQGQYPLFTPPEVVGGTGSPYLLAFLFSIFSASAVTFRLLSLIGSGLYIVSVGWLAKSAYDKRVAILALAFASLAPAYMQFVGLKLWSSYIETMVFGQFLFIAVYQLLNSESRRKIIFWVIFCGIIAGLMFWLTWLGVYYIVPVGVVMLWKGRQIIWRWGWLGIISFFVGSLPFWLFNIPRGMSTFERFVSDTPMTFEQSSRVLIDFVTVRFPILVSGHPSWGYTAELLAIALALVYTAGLGIIIYQARSKQVLQVLLALLIFNVPILYAIGTNSRNTLPEFNPWGVDTTGRYILMWHSVLPIGLALVIDRLWQWRRQGAFILFMILLAINTLGTLSVNPHRAFDSPYYDRLPHDLTPLIDFLDERDIHYAWVDGGIGHVLMFLTQEQVLTEDYHSIFLAGGLLRQPAVLQKIQSAQPTILITPIYEEQENPPLQQAIEAQSIDYEMVRVTPTLAVYIIDGNIDPMQFASGLGYQY